jgi:hypothetical protein
MHRPLNVKTCFDRSMATREMCGLSLTFTDFKVQRSHPDSTCSGTASRLSVDITFFAICDIYTRVISKEV